MATVSGMRQIPVWAQCPHLAAFAIPRASRVHDVLQVEGRSVQINESDRAQTIIRGRFRQPLSHFFAVTVQGPITVDSTPYRQVLHTLTRVAREPPAPQQS